MINLTLEDEGLQDTSFRTVLAYCNYWLDDTGNKFSFSNINIGKHLINLLLVETKKNMILEVEKRNEGRVTIKFRDAVEPMAKMNNGDWRRMFRDTKGIRK